MPLESLLGQAHEFRAGAEVPVGVANFGMAQIGRQHRQPSLDVLSVPIPLPEGLQCKSMPKIVQVRAAPIPLLDHANLLEQALKGVERPVV